MSLEQFITANGPSLFAAAAALLAYFKGRKIDRSVAEVHLIVNSKNDALQAKLDNALKEIASSSTTQLTQILKTIESKLDAFHKRLDTVEKKTPPAPA